MSETTELNIPKTAEERTADPDIERIENWFQYHAPVGDQAQRYERIRAAGKEMAKVLIELCPPSADRDVAIGWIRTAVYVANASIACAGN